MPRISNEQIIDIRNKANIVEIISEYVPLVQKGKNYFGVCPFHDDHNPSMSVSPEKQIYTCFVCGATGNVFSFLMEYEHLNFIEAVKMVAQKLNIPLDIDSSYNVPKQEDKNSKWYEMYTLTNKFYQNCLNTKEGTEAKAYLKSRTFNDELIKHFEVGLAPFGSKVYQLLKGSQFSNDDIIKLGLCSVNDNGMHDTFVNRIMFPLWDLDGHVVGFSGRIYNNEDSAKYVNSKESIIFKKGTLLYNYHLAKEDIRKSKSIIIVEGFMDVIALYRVGIKNVVATMGTAITDVQAKLIKKLSPNVILCFDGDEAGNKATISCSNELVKLGIIPKIIRLDNQLDPDEYIKQNGADKFMYYLENPISFIDFKMMVYKKGKNLSNSEDISLYIKEVMKELTTIDDPILRELVLKKVSDETGVFYDTLVNMANKDKPTVKKEPNNNKELYKKEKIVQNKYDKAEQRLLFHMLKHKEVIKLFDNSNCLMLNQLRRYLANEIITFYRQYQYINMADLMAFLGEKKDLIKVLNEIVVLDLPDNYLQEEINDYIELLNTRAIEMEIERLKKLFKEANNPLTQAEIGNQITNLKKRSDISGE